MKELYRLPLFCPQKPTTTQSKFLATESLEALFGYSAGGGKTTALLMAALQYVDIPGYNAVIFRRTFRDLFLPGAIGDRFKYWMNNHNEEIGWGPETIGWDGYTNAAIFPSGAKLHFGYLDSAEDHLRYKSCKFQFIGIDQVEEIRECDYQYLMSRFHRPTTGPVSLIPLRMRVTTTWGTEWIEERFVANLDRTVILSTLEDNPHIDQEAYRAALETLDHAHTARVSITPVKVHEMTSEEENQLIEKIVKNLRERLERNFWPC